MGHSLNLPIVVRLVILVGLVSISASASAHPKKSGVFLSVKTTKNCEGSSRGCIKNPFLGKIQIFKNIATPVAIKETDGNGEARITLPPGRYQVKPIIKPPQTNPTEVVVEPGVFTTVTIYLSGQ